MLLAKQRWVWGERPQIFESSPILHAPKLHKSDLFMFLRPEVQSHFHFLMSPLFLECQSEACQASPHLLWSRSVFPCCQFWTIPQKSASSNSAPSNDRKGAIFCYSHSIISFNLRSRVDSIAASLFRNNWLSWQKVLDDKIPNNITDTGARCLV